MPFLSVIGDFLSECELAKFLFPHALVAGSCEKLVSMLILSLNPCLWFSSLTVVNGSWRGHRTESGQIGKKS